MRRYGTVTDGHRGRLAAQLLMMAMMLLPLLMSWTGTGAVATGSSGFNTTAVAALIDRVVGEGGSTSFVLQLDPQLAGCQSPVNECVALANLPGGKIGITATSLPSLGFGVGTYLRSSCNASLTWVKTGGLNARCKPSALPPVAKDAARIYERSVKWTYYQNVVDSSYSFVWWDHARWRTEVDWMSLIGINIALVYTGQEKVLLNLYKQFGVDLTNSSGDLDYFNGPAYLSWSRGQSQAGVGASTLSRPSRPAARCHPGGLSSRPISARLRQT